MNDIKDKPRVTPEDPHYPRKTVTEYLELWKEFGWKGEPKPKSIYIGHRE